jgi:hypothetical protein
MLLAKTPVQATAPALQPLLALGVEDGVFVIAAAPAELAQIEAFARVESEPMPRFVMGKAYLSPQPHASGQTTYTAFIPWPTAPAGPLLLGCVTANKRKPVFKVNCLPYHQFAPQALLEIIKRFGRALIPALKANLSPTHPLWQRLAPVRSAVIPAVKDVIADPIRNPGCPDSSMPGQARHDNPFIAANDAAVPTAHKTRARRKRISQ